MQLTKHHGLGNDFLTLGDYERAPLVDPDLARAVCDRHHGVGADGLLLLGPGSLGADVTMVLLNADGSRAEMSGNGIACLAQAATVWEFTDETTIKVTTDVGLRTVELSPGEAPHTHIAVVDMGAAALDEDSDLPEWAGGDILRATHVSMGNPHLVLLAGDADLLDDRDWVASLGRQANDAIPGGVNVEVVAVAEADGELRMDVYERGVGLTLACGTGACAAAAAARRWELIDDEVTVRMPGGPAAIALTDGQVHMTVPVTYVADVEYHTE